jgi:hypothetical protein
MTFWPGGLRATGPQPAKQAHRVLVLGGSFTQGWAVSDAETYPWRLQAAFRGVEVLNFGTAGYGTYQSLLTLERYFAEVEMPPELVIYGFIDGHQARNVAAAPWLRALSSFSGTAAIKVPYVTLDASDRLQRQEPVACPQLPLREASAAVAFLEDRYLKLTAGRRSAQAQAVTHALLLEMDRVSKAHDTELLIAVLGTLRTRATQQYLRFLGKEGIKAVDCTHPNPGHPSMRVPGYGHPSGKLNHHWANCIQRVLRERDFPNT